MSIGSSILISHLSLNNIYQFIETYKQLDNDSLQDFINSEEYATHKNQIEEYVNDFLNQKKRFFLIDRALIDINIYIIMILYTITTFITNFIGKTYYIII